MAKAVDWLGVETDYRMGQKSLRKIAADHGTSEGTVRRKAKQFGWVRDGSLVKREKVKAHFAGKPPPEVANKPEAVLAAIEEAVGEDIHDMNLGLDNARRALLIVNATLKALAEDDQAARLLMVDARNLKTLTETNRYNVDVIRRIRGLDDQPDARLNDLTEEDEAVLEMFRGQCRD